MADTVRIRRHGAESATPCGSADTDLWTQQHPDPDDLQDPENERRPTCWPGGPSSRR